MKCMAARRWFSLGLYFTLGLMFVADFHDLYSFINDGKHSLDLIAKGLVISIQ
jgi:hypothetical protein